MSSTEPSGLVWYLFVGFISCLVLLGSVYLFAADEYLLFVLLMAVVIACVALLFDQRTLVIIALLGSPTFFVFINDALTPIPFVTAERLIFVLLFAPLIIGTIYRRRPPVRLLMVERLILILVAIMLVSLIVGLQSRPESQQGPDISFFFQGYLMPLVGFILVRRQSWSEGRIRRLFHWIAVTGAISGIVAIIHFATGTNILEASWIELNTQHEGRATGPFANSTEFGGVCLMGMIAGMWLIRDARGQSIFWLVFAILLSIIGVLLSQTRAVWVAVILATFLLAYFDPRIRKLVFGPAILAMVATALVVPFIAGNSQFQERITEVSPIYNRLTSIGTAGNVIADHPITGVGFGKKTFEIAKPGRYADFGGVSGSYAVNLGPPHNEWLHMIAMLGIPAGLMYIVIWAIMGRNLYQYAKREARGVGQTAFGIPIFVSFVIMVIYTFLLDTGFLSYLPLATWILAAIAMSVSREQNRLSS